MGPVTPTHCAPWARPSTGGQRKPPIGVPGVVVGAPTMATTRNLAAGPRPRGVPCTRIAAAVILAASALSITGAMPGGTAKAQDTEGGSGRSAASMAERHVDEGRRLYAELDFAGAVNTLRRALDVPGIPDAVRIEALEYLGSAYVVLERPELARDAFAAMIDLDPYHPVREPSGSPKIMQFVENLRRELVPDAALDPTVELRPRLPRAGRVGRATAIRFSVEGNADVATVRVFYRGMEGGDAEAVEATATDDGHFRATIPARDEPDELELFAEARDARARVVTRAGEPLAPISLPIRLEATDGAGGSATSGGGILTEWWFWTAVGVVASGAVVAGFTLGGGTAAPSGTLPPGRVELP